MVRTRGEITGRRPRATAGRAKRKIPNTQLLIVEPDSSAGEPPMPVLAFTVQQFCQLHQLSLSMFYKLKAQGRGPQEMAYGRRRAISLEAAARWRAEREAEVTAMEAAE